MDATTLLRDGVDYDSPRRAGEQAARPHRDLNPFLRKLNRRRGFLTVVVLPTLVSAIYFFGVAAQQYESEAHFVVKIASQPNSSPTSGLAQMFGLGGALNPSQSESLSVSDYLSSHDAVAALRRRLNLLAIFQRPEADPLSRLWGSHPTAEQLLKYYRREVKVAYSSDTGITTLRVRAFRAVDAQAVAEALLELGEQRVNTLNNRVLADAENLAERQLHEAEGAVASNEAGITHFRQESRDIDPEHSGIANITMLASLRAELTQERAQLAAMAATIQPDSPQYTSMADRVRALQTQVESEAGKLAGQPGAAAPRLSAFEGLRLRQDFASKRYENAAAALQAARLEALKQQLYLLRIVEPNMPEKALYPQRLTIVASVFFAAFLIYGIGSLIIAGVREHGH